MTKRTNQDAGAGAESAPSARVDAVLPVIQPGDVHAGEMAGAQADLAAANERFNEKLEAAKSNGGFTKQMAREPVRVRLNWEIYKTPDGAAIDFIFTFRKLNEGEDQSATREAILQNQTAGQQRKNLFFMLLEGVEGFDDFPQDNRPFKQRARAYFDDPDMADFIKYAMAGYDAAVVPRQLFRMF